MFDRKVEERVIIREVAKAPKDGFVHLDEYVSKFKEATVEHRVRASLIERVREDAEDRGSVVYLKDGTVLHVKDDCESIIYMIEGATD